jgi:hypothetical protein
MVDVTGIEPGVPCRDPMRLAPERLTLEDPGSLIFREVLNLQARHAHN